MKNLTSITIKANNIKTIDGLEVGGAASEGGEATEGETILQYSASARVISTPVSVGTSSPMRCRSDLG